MITVVTPSVRKENLDIIEKCLRRQTFKNSEWLVGSPEDYGYGKYIKEPSKKEGDYYGLNKSYNSMFRKARGELIVSIQDGIWFPPDLLEKFWNHYLANSKAIVGAVGHQYKEVVNGKPEGMIWQDPRARGDQGVFYETLPSEIEYTVCSLPKQAIIDVRGLKEEWDKYAALSEKEMNVRMTQKGYTMYLDQSQEYRAIHHPRLSPDWDERYQQGCVYFGECIKKVLQGEELEGDL